jgi:phosphoribosylanthranilate isomerase
MTVAVKICGLNSREAAEAAIAAKADFGGLVFFPKSPRHVSLEAARSIAALLRGKAQIVTLLVDPKDEDILQITAAVDPDLIQLHGNEGPARVAAIAALAARPVIKAIAVAEAEDVAAAHAYENAADYLLFDAKANAFATRPGGLGTAFDWQLLSRSSFRKPWGLAGGLTPNNVARAIRIAAPHFVDASSGVEDAPGKKSAEKIAAFVSAARNAPYTTAKAGAA